MSNAGQEEFQKASAWQSPKKPFRETLERRAMPPRLCASKISYLLLATAYSSIDVAEPVSNAFVLTQISLDRGATVALGSWIPEQLVRAHLFLAAIFRQSPANPHTSLPLRP